MSKRSWYARWHSNKYHNVVHYLILAAFSYMDVYLLYQLKEAINTLS